MSEETLPEKPEDDGCKSSNFWVGLLVGLPIYPLVMPWVLLSIPEDWMLTYTRLYGGYVRFVAEMLGFGQPWP